MTATDFAADTNAWGLMPTQFAPPKDAPPIADVADAIKQILEAVGRHLPTAFAPPAKKAKKGRLFQTPWGSMWLLIEKTRVRRQSWERVGVQLDVTLSARVTAVEKPVGLDAVESRALLAGGMLPPRGSSQYWQLETFGIEGIAYVLARVMNGWHELVDTGLATVGALLVANEKLAKAPTIEPFLAKIPRIFADVRNERNCRPSSQLGPLELAAAAAFVAANEHAAARTCLEVFRANPDNGDLRGSGVNSYYFGLSGPQRADLADAVAALIK